VRGTKKNPYFILIIFRRHGRCRFRVIFLWGEIKFSQGLLLPPLQPPNTQISVNQFWSLSSDKNKPQPPMEAQPPAFPFVMGKIIEFVNDCHRRWVQKKKKKIYITTKDEDFKLPQPESALKSCEIYATVVGVRQTELCLETIFHLCRHTSSGGTTPPQSLAKQPSNVNKFLCDVFKFQFRHTHIYLFFDGRERLM